MIHPLIRNEKIFVVVGHSRTVYVGSEIPVRQTAQTLMENFVGDFPDGAVFLQLQHSELSIMIACHKKKAVGVIRRQITASHAVDGSKIQKLQPAVLPDLICLHAEIRDGIKIFFVVGDGHIGGIGDFHLILLDKPPILHVYIVYFYSMVVPLGVSGYICHIFFFFHVEYLLRPFLKYSTKSTIVKYFFQNHRKADDFSPASRQPAL